MSRKNSDRFLRAFSAIEQLLRAKTRSEKPTSFYRLVEAAAERDRAVRSFATDLKEYADLRNAIVHESGGGEPIAEPHTETVERLEGIRDVLERPPRVESGFLREVARCGPNDRVGAAAAKMLNGDFSQVPVYDDSEFVALLTAETIARWLAAKLETDIGMLDEEPVRSVLDHTEDAENHAFVGRKSTLFEVLDLFAEFDRKGKSLDALLVTQSGKKDEAPIGILTVFDLPKVYEGIAVGRS